MTKWIIVIVILTAFPFSAYAQNDAAVMQSWIGNNFGINIPNPEISQDWKSLPVVGGCNYEWHVRWNDTRFQVRDTYDNYYRISYQGDTLTLDFTRDFNGFFGG